MGLGVKSGDLSVNAFNEIKSSDYVLLRTEKTASCAFLKENGIDYVVLDYVY